MRRTLRELGGFSPFEGISSPSPIQRVAGFESSARFQLPDRSHPFLNRSVERVELSVLHNKHAL